MKTVAYSRIQSSCKGKYKLCLATRVQSLAANQLSVKSIRTFAFCRHDCSLLPAPVARSLSFILQTESPYKHRLLRSVVPYQAMLVAIVQDIFPSRLQSSKSNQRSLSSTRQIYPPNLSIDLIPTAHLPASTATTNDIKHSRAPKT